MAVATMQPSARGLLSLDIAHMPVRRLAKFLRTQSSAYATNKGMLYLVKYADDAMSVETEETVRLGGWNFAALEIAITGRGPMWYVARKHEPLTWMQVRVPWSEPGARNRFFHTMRAELIRRQPPWDLS